MCTWPQIRFRFFSSLTHSPPLFLSFCCRFSIYAHSLACSICQLHADVTPPRAAHLPAMATTCPALAPTSASINRRAYYTMQCVPGSMEESPLSIPHPSFCIPYREHAATFLASSRCVCICPTVRQTGAENFLCCICPVAAHSWSERAIAGEGDEGEATQTV